MKRKKFTMLDTAKDKVLIRTDDYRKIQKLVNEAENVCNIYCWINEWKEIILAICSDEGYLFKSKYFGEETK